MITRTILSSLPIILFTDIVFAEDQISMQIQMPFPDGYERKCWQNSDDSPSHGRDEHNNKIKAPYTLYDLDFATSVGTIITAGAEGDLYYGSDADSDGKGGGFGWYARIEHNNGYWTMYGHLSSYIAQNGQHVVAGQPIAYSGGAKGAQGAGNSTGPHIHIGVHSGSGLGLSQRMEVYALDTITGEQKYFATGSQGQNRDFTCFNQQPEYSNGVIQKPHTYKTSAIGKAFSDFVCRSLSDNNGVLCWSDNPTTCEDGSNHVRYFKAKGGAYQSESNVNTWFWCLKDSGTNNDTFAFLKGHFGVGGGSEPIVTPIGGNPSTIAGSITDLVPDFDVFSDRDKKHEISANCNNCSGKAVNINQTVWTRLTVEVNNADADKYKRIKSHEKISGNIWWRIEGETDWSRVSGDSNEYTISKLDEGKKISETRSWSIPNYPGKILALIAAVDTDDEIQEAGEAGGNGKNIDSPDKDCSGNNNCSRIERFYIRPPSLNSDLIVSSLGLKEGNSVDYGSVIHPFCAIRNVGTEQPSSDIRSAYYIDGKYRDDDGSEADQLVPGRDQYEEVLNDGIRADTVGTRTLMCCADYQGSVSELDESNNCATATFEVRPNGPDLIVSGLGFKEGTTIKKGSKVHPYCVIRNIGNVTPSSDIRSAYYIDGAYRDDDGSEADQLTPGRDQYEEVLNDNIKLGNTGNRTLKCCADYQNSVLELDEGNNCKSLSFVVK